MQTDFNQFSLLYPDGETRRAHFAGEDSPIIDAFTLSELGMDDILPLKNSRLTDFLTMSPAVIRYRQSVFADMLAHEEIGKTLTVIEYEHDNTNTYYQVSFRKEDEEDFVKMSEEGLVAAFIYCNRVLKDGKGYKYSDADDSERAVVKSGVMMLPVSFFEKFLLIIT